VTGLVWLYPPAWRRRYGGELADLISTQPASFGNAIDLVAAAIDAWLNRQSSTAAAADAKGAGAMDFRMLKLRCAGYGPNVTSADAWKAAAVTILGTLALVLPALWAYRHYGSNPYLEALMLNSWMFAFLFSLRYTSLKGRAGLVQAVFIVGTGAIVMAIALGAVWLGTSN
jgi:hypothetical protein